MELITLTPQTLTFEEILVGKKAELRWVVTGGLIDEFAQLSGDFNPLHVDADFARGQGFEDRVAHGFLLGSKVSAFIGMILPGRNSLLLEVLLSWPKPVYPDDEVTLSGEVVERSQDQRVIRIKIKATKIVGVRTIEVGRGWALCRLRS